LVLPLFGAGAIQKRINNIALNDQIQAVEYLDGITTIQQERTAMNPDFFPETYSELFPFDSGHSTPWSYWDVNNQNHANSAYSSSNDEAYCQSVLDTIINFYAPRACVALNLVCHSDSFPNVINDLERQAMQLRLSPNPAQTNVLIQTENDLSIQSIEVYNLNGSLVKSFTPIHKSSFNMERGNLPNGLYTMKIYVENGFVAKKIVFN